MSVPLDELGFFNEQLAAMLRQGLPLEGALRELSQRMGQSEFKEELRKLEADLAQGIPLAQALPKRRLPEFYVQTVLAGVKGNDLPAVLTLLADYYGQVQSIWLRLKGLMVYPALVLIVALFFSGWVAFLQHPVLAGKTIEFVSAGNRTSGWGSVLEGAARFHVAYFWLPPISLLAVVLIAAGALTFPQTRRALRWRLPAFKEASLAQFASALHVLLRTGSTLHEALGFLLPIEAGTLAGAEIERWRRRLEDGHGKFPDITEGSRLFPPLFLWLAASSGDDLEAGFKRAAEVYRERASYRIELLLNATLPASMVALGIMVALQIYPMASQAFESLRHIYEAIPL